MLLEKAGFKDTKVEMLFHARTASMCRQREQWHFEQGYKYGT
jgi:hypothetical protein